MFRSKFFKIIYAVFVAITVSIFYTTNNNAFAAEFTMKIGLPTINDPIHNFAIRYGKELEKRSNGRIEVRIFPSGQLGTMPSQASALQTGVQEGLVAPTGFMAGMNKAIQVVDAPGIFASQMEAHEAVNYPEFREKYVNLPVAAGVKGVSLWVYGPSVFVSTKPLKNSSDLKGLKIRVLATPMERAIVGAYGVTGVPMPFIEALPAVQRGTIDGVRSTIAVLASMKYYNTTKYVLRTEGSMFVVGLWVSKIWLDGLPKDLQKIVEDTGLDVSRSATEFAIEANTKAVTIWEKAGALVTTLSPEEKTQYFSKLYPLGDEMLGNDPKTSDMWRLLKSVKTKVTQ